MFRHDICEKEKVLYEMWYRLKCRMKLNKYANARICDEWWDDFSSFCKWANENGYYDGLHLVRKDLTENFEPANCLFVNESEVYTYSPKKLRIENKRLYGIWIGMKSRCYNEKVSEYKYYGARGITIADEWYNDFPTFCKWSLNNGYRYDLSIDRKHVDGNYEPSNCKWSTSKEQANNKRFGNRP